MAWEDGGQRFGFPRVSVACDFKRPVRFRDVLEIAVTVEEVGRKSVRYRFDFSHDGKKSRSGGSRRSAAGRTPDHGIESVEIPAGVRERLAGA